MTNRNIGEAGDVLKYGHGVADGCNRRESMCELFSEINTMPSFSLTTKVVPKIENPKAEIHKVVEIEKRLL